MRFAQPFIPAYQRGQRNALGRGERGVPSRAVFHRARLVAVLIDVFSRRLVPDELFAGDRVLALRQTLEVFLANLTM